MLRLWLLLLTLLATGAAADQRPVLSLVIDDLGYSLKQGMAAIDLDGDQYLRHPAGNDLQPQAGPARA